MKKYLLTVLSVVFSITLMGQTEFTITSDSLTYTVINPTNNYVSVKRQQNMEIKRDLIIPDSVTYNGVTYTVTEIAYQGFYQVNQLKRVTLPNTITKIGNEAFKNNGNLEKINIPNSVTEIGTAAFQACHKLGQVILPDGLEVIPNSLFADCYNLREIIVPATVTSVGEYAFAQTHNTEIIFLNCGTITIGNDAFQNCHDEDIEILCLEGILNFEGNTNFGNNFKIHVPCGKENYYQNQFPNANISTDNCVSISRQTGDFCDPATWEGYEDWDLRGDYELLQDQDKEAWLKGEDQNDPDDDRWPYFVPRTPMHPFYIQEGHTVTLKHRRDIYPFNSVNNGVMVIDATCSDENHNHYGQLIERDSVLFDANITLNVDYRIEKHNNTIYLIKDYPITTTTDITSLLDDPEIGNTIGDYKTEHIFNNNDNIYIRDTETRYLLSITQEQENNTYGVTVKDKDYYRTDNNKIYYYGTATAVGADGLIIDNLLDYTENTTNEGFYKDGTSYIKHVFPYNNHTATATIDRNTGDVTLHGTDYSYGHVRMHVNFGGEIEVKVPAVENKWNFVGAPFNVYDLYAVKLYNNSLDASAVRFDYGANDWETVLSYGEDTIRPGEGFLAWPFYEGGITFSTKRDYGPNAKNGDIQPKIMRSDFVLNNDTVYVEKDIATDNTNKWMALANPYPAKLCVKDFIENNTPNSSNPNPDPARSNTEIQGLGVYILNVNSPSSKWDFMDSEDNFDLGVGQGFFVNVQNNGTNKIMFTKSQIHGYLEPQCEHGVNHSAKSSSQREIIRLSMIADNVASELLFAHNEDAQQYYDIYDANKLFAIERMTEPYFVTDGIKLVKEEVKEVPYYATMNVRSYEEKEVKFRADYIPEGYAVSIIDGEETIDLNPGVEYTTEVSVGENANRFKVLVKKSVGLNDVEELAIDITNSNRIVNISTNETNLQIEVYNALGQKVLSTRSLNFSLNEVSAGAYMIKAFNSKGSKTQKIIVK